MVYPKNATLSNTEDKCKGIVGLRVTENPFKAINIYPITDVQEMGLITSGQKRSKEIKSELRGKIKFTHNNNPLHSDKESFYLASTNTTVKSKVKINLNEAVNYFKESSLDTTSFISSTPTELNIKIRCCLTIDDPKYWKVRRAWVSQIG